MSSSQAPVPMATLLSHREWVRQLARSLVRDEASADDIEQGTWLTALRSPPRRADAARAWLTRVVRNQTLNALRAGSRRAVHEAAGARGEPERSAAEVVAEAETHKRLVDAVLALAEPYRSTVLLRYFAALPPRAIAERMSVPAETVRTRVKRALVMLREDLARAGGGGDAWIAAVAPFAGVRLGAGVAGTTSGTTGAVAAGGTIMAGKAAVAAVAALGVAAGFAGSTLTGSVAPPAPAADVAALERRIESLESARRADAARSAAPASVARASSAEERQAEQERRIAALEADVAAAVKGTAELSARLAASARGQVDAEAELVRLKGMTTDDLLDEIRRLMAGRGNGPEDRVAYEGAVRACDVVMSRDIPAVQRCQSLIAKGVSLRELADLKRAEAALREAMTLVTPASDEGRGAAIQLGWTLVRKRDPRAAADVFLAVTRQPDSPPGQRAWLRHCAAGFLASAGDTARARDEYRAVVEEFADSDEPQAKDYAERSRKEIEKLDRSGR